MTSILKENTAHNLAVHLVRFCNGITVCSHCPIAACCEQEDPDCKGRFLGQSEDYWKQRILLAMQSDTHKGGTNE